MAASTEKLKELYVALTAKDEGQRQAIEQVTKDLEREQVAVNKLNLALDPKVIKLRAQQMIALNDQQARYNRLLAEEMERQAPTVTEVEPTAMAQGGLGRALGLTEEGATALTGVLGSVGIAFTAVAAGAGLAYAALNKFKDEVIRLSAIANPVAVERFNLALDDAQGVIGLRMVPLLERFTQVVRIFGDFLATILPSASQIESVLKDLDPGLQEIRQALADMAPIIKIELVGALRLMVPLLKEWAFQMRILASLNPFVMLSKAFGLSGGDLTSSRGASARPAQFVGLEELSKQAAISAYSQGYEQPDMQTARNTEQIAKTLADFFTWAQAVKDVTGVTAQDAWNLSGIGAIGNMARLLVGK